MITELWTKHKFGRRAVSALLVVLLLATISVSLTGAGIGDGFSVAWWTVDGGGNRSQGDGYVLSGTAGQPDAVTTLEGGGYSLAGGFWAAGASHASAVYLPIVLH